MKRTVVCVVLVCLAWLISAPILSAQEESEEVYKHTHGFTWSPDGTMVAFISLPLDGPAAIVIANADGTDPQMVDDRNIGYLSEPLVWSPNSQMLVYGEGAGYDAPFDRVYLVEKSYVRSVVGTAGFSVDYFAQNHWSADSRYLLGKTVNYGISEFGPSILMLDVESWETEFITYAQSYNWNYTQDEILVTRGNEFYSIRPGEDEPKFEYELTTSNLTHCAMSHNSNLLACVDGGLFYTLDGENWEQVGSAGFKERRTTDRIPVWSNDDRLVAFQLRKLSYRPPVLAVFDTATNSVIYSEDAPTDWYGWSPDNRLLVDNSDSPTGLSLLTVETGTLTPWPNFN